MLTVVALLAGQYVSACPCSLITVPDKDPPYNNVGGLRFSHTLKYRQEFEEAIRSARRYCETHLDAPRRAVVSDLDETLFDNREFDAANPQFDRSRWLEWVRQESAPLYRQTADLLSWARSKGFAVFLVTTRGEDTKVSTISNLLKDGILYDGLFMRPPGNTESHQTLKTAFRKEIQRMGFTILVNIGDQFSDLAGGYAEDCEKLPNQMYFHR